MNVNMGGWVETVENDGWLIWQGAIHMDELLAENPEFCTTLFTLNNSPIRWADTSAPLGLPSDLSFEGRLYDAYRHQYGSMLTDFLSQNWMQGSILWQEFKSLDLDKKAQDSELTRRQVFEMKGWRELMDMLKILERIYSDDHIRLVVWMW